MPNSTDSSVGETHGGEIQALLDAFMMSRKIKTEDGIVNWYVNSFIDTANTVLEKSKDDFKAVVDVFDENAIGSEIAGGLRALRGEGFDITKDDTVKTSYVKRGEVCEKVRSETQTLDNIPEFADILSCANPNEKAKYCSYVSEANEQIEKTIAESFLYEHSREREIKQNSEAYYAKKLSELRISREELMNRANLREHAEAEVAQKNERLALRKRKTRTPALIVFAVAALIILTFFVTPYVTKSMKNSTDYEAALALLESGQLTQAAAAFTALGGYKDSAEQALQAKYDAARIAQGENRYAEAAALFEELGDYKDSAEQALQAKYDAARTVQGDNKYAEAAALFAELGDYKDSAERREKSLSVLRSISAGYEHTVGIKADGTVVAVGSFYYGKLKVSDWENIIAVSAGYAHTVGLRADGTVVAVGFNSSAQLFVYIWEDITAIAAGYMYTIGLKADGTVVTTSYNGSQKDINSWENITAIAAGALHVVGLKADGTVVAAGYTDNRLNVSDWENIISIAAGDRHTVGLKADGTVVAAGDNSYGQLNVSDWEDIIAIAAGFNYTVGLKADGTVVAVGNNHIGQCDVSDWEDIIAITAGSVHTVGLKSDGSVVAAGYNKYNLCGVSDWNLFE